MKCFTAVLRVCVLTVLWFCFACSFSQPERIDPQSFGHGYDVRSDIWSLGIMLVSNIFVLYSDVLSLLFVLYQVARKKWQQ